MTNYVEVDLRATGSKLDIDEFVHYMDYWIYNTDTSINISSDLIPYPPEKEIYDQAIENYKATEAHKTAHETGKFDWNIVKMDWFAHGGMEWCTKNWGSKWGIFSLEKIEKNIDGKLSNLNSGNKKTSNKGSNLKKSSKTRLNPPRMSHATYHFRNAWDPAEPLFTKLAERFNKITLEFTYFEYDIYYHGLYRYVKGKLTEHWQINDVPEGG